MVYSETALLNPYFWFFTSGILLGIALRFFIVIPKLAFDVEGDMSLRLTLAPIFASGAILLALAGVVVPATVTGGGFIFSINLAYCVAIATAVSFLISRFFKAIGIPILFLTSILGIFYFAGLAEWTPFTSDVRALEIRILSRQPSSDGISYSYSVETIDPTGKSEFFTATLNELSFSGRILSTRMYMFLGPRKVYRLGPLTAEPSNRSFFRWIDAAISAVPWLDETIFRVSLDDPLSPATYALILDQRGEANLIPTYLLYRSR